MGLLVLLLSIASAVSADTKHKPRLISLDSVHTQDLLADQPISYEFAAQANKSYLIEVDQGGLDLVVTVENPSGESTSFNSPLFRDESEIVLVDTTKAGLLTVTLLCNEHTGATGHVSIQISEVLPTTPAEQERLKALRLISEASKANHQGNLEGWNSALEGYQQASIHARKTGENRLWARSLYSIAFIEYWQLSKWDRSASLASQAAEIYQENGYGHLAANAIQLQAASIIEKANGVKKSGSSGLAPEAQVLFDEALQLFQKALVTQEKLGFEYDVARITNNIGFTYYYMGEWDTATSWYQKAAEYYRRADEWQDELYPLNNLAVIDREKGNLVAAIEWFQRTLAVLPPNKMLQYKAHTLDNLAAAQLELGKLDDALQSFSRALAIHEQIDDLKGQGRSLAGIGAAYTSIGEQELALEFLETALATRQEANDGRGQVAVLNAIGNIQRQNGNYAAALDAHSQASQMATSPIDHARTMLRIAEDQVAAGQPKEAIETLASVDLASGKINNQKLLAETLRISGEARLQAGQYQSSLDAFVKAEKAFESLGLSAERAQSTFGSAKADRELGKLDQALEYARQAISLVENLRSQLISPELRAFFLSSRQQYYAFQVDLLMAMHEQSPADSDHYMRDALAASERSRARALIDLISEASVKPADSNVTGIIENQTRLFQQMAESRYRLNRLLDNPDETAPEAQISSIKQELAEIENQLNLLQIEYRKQDPGYASLTNPQILDAGQIQALLDEDTALLHYALGKQRSFLWLVTRDSIEAWSLPGRGTIEKSAKKVHALLEAPSFSSSAKADLNASINDLSRQILGPAGRLPKKRVVIVADGVLQYLPFSILNSPDQSNAQKPLLTNHEIVYLPSMSVLAMQRQKHQDLKDTNRKIAIFADPVFESTDDRFRDNPVGDTEPEVSQSSRTLTRGNSARLNRLPATTQEAMAIARLVDPDQRLLAVGFDASRNSVFSSNLGDYQIVHFATHGLIDSRYPALSALAFSKFDENGKALDGLLRLHDIYNLELNADLVTLSACSTALGREIAGEGLTGLTQGLMHSGSRSVLASLWQVSDRATAELMKRFYQNLLDKKQKPAAALRNAQLELSSVARWRSPYFWSAFVLQGDWQ